MHEASLIQSICDMFEGVNVDTADGSTFFSCDPERKFPFATIVTKDNDYDDVSNLDRPGVFRLNVSLDKAGFQAKFDDDTEHDFTALDRLMPHPKYGRMHWICVLNPSAATFRIVQPLLAAAHARAVAKQAKRARPDAV